MRRNDETEIEDRDYKAMRLIGVIILAVDIFAVADLDHVDDQILVFDGIDNSVTALSNTILVLT